MRYPLGRTRVRVLHFPRPQRLDVWCRRRGVGEAIVGGFFVRDPYRALGELWVGGARGPLRAGRRARTRASRACVISGRGRRALRARAATRPSRRRGDLVQAGPLLVAGGAVAFDPPTTARASRAAPGSSTPTSRTAAIRARRSGSAPRDVIAVACDGRRSGVDAGLSMLELAQVMVELGAESAINLDGGGSTTLVHRGHLLNRPYSSQDQPAPQSRPDRQRARVRAGHVMRRAARGSSRVLAAAALTVSLLALFADRNVFDADGFADRTEQTLQSDAVSAELARRLTDAALRAQPDLIARPAAGERARPRASCAAPRSARSCAPRRATSTARSSTATRRTVTLTIVDAGVLLNEAIDHLRPDLARAAPESLRRELYRRGRAGDRRRARRWPSACGARGGLAACAALLLAARRGAHGAGATRDGVVRRRVRGRGRGRRSPRCSATFAPPVLIENAGARGVLATWLDPLAVWCWALFGAGPGGGVGGGVDPAPASCSCRCCDAPATRVLHPPDRPWPRAGARRRGDRARRAGDRGPADRARGPASPPRGCCWSWRGRASCCGWRAGRPCGAPACAASRARRGSARWPPR